MAKLVVAVASTRRPKLDAVRAALDEIDGRLWMPGIEIIGREVPSGVGHTPSSREELMAGARNRAETLHQIARAEGRDWKYCMGLEADWTSSWTGPRKAGGGMCFLEAGRPCSKAARVAARSANPEECCCQNLCSGSAGGRRRAERRNRRLRWRRGDSRRAGRVGDSDG